MNFGPIAVTGSGWPHVVSRRGSSEIVPQKQKCGPEGPHLSRFALALFARFYAALTSASSNSSACSPVFSRSAISWHGMQNGVHGTAASRFGLISSSQCRHAPKFRVHPAEGQSHVAQQARLTVEIADGQLPLGRVLDFVESVRALFDRDCFTVAQHMRQFGPPRSRICLYLLSSAFVIIVPPEPISFFRLSLAGW